MSEEIDLGRETSTLLTEVRTVLSRAETALYGYGADRSWISAKAALLIEGEKGHRENGHYIVDSPAVRIPHPDRDEIQAALEQVVELLSPWRRTGPKKK